MSLISYDKSLNKIETPGGVITLTSLFLPFFIEMVLTNSMGTVNTLALSHYSDHSVAAVGVCAQIMGMIYTFYGVVSAGASIVISQNLGAGKYKTAGDAGIISIVFSACLGLAMGLILSLFAEPILTLMNLSDDLLQEAVTYFRICITFSFFQAIYTSVSSIFRSYGKSRTAVKVSLFMSVTNALLNILIVFRPFPFPLKGVWGIAVSSVISQALGMCLLLCFLKKASFHIQLKRDTLKHISLIGKILSIGIPGGLSSLSYSLSQVISTSIVVTLGATSVSAKIYLDNIFFYVYVLGLALGQATAIMISHLAGAHKFNQAAMLNKQNLKITIFFNISLSLFILLSGKYLIGIFTDNSEIIKIAGSIMVIDLFVEIGRGFNHIENNSLRGSGDVLFPMIISITSCWIISILFSYLLGIKLGLGLMGCWFAFAMDELFRGVLFYLRWRSGKWRGKVLL